MQNEMETSQKKGISRPQGDKMEIRGEKWEKVQWRVENEMCTFVISTVSMLGYQKIKKHAKI